MAVVVLGARQHYALAALFQAQGWLTHFYTDAYVGNSSVVARLLRRIPPWIRPASIDRLLGRSSDDVAPDRIRSFDVFAVRYQWMLRSAASSAAKSRVYARAADLFARAAQRSVFDASDVLVAANGPAFGLFRQRRLGVCLILEQLLAPQRVVLSLLDEEHRRWPGWESASGDSEASPFLAREEEEWALADAIMSGSAFVTRELHALGVPASKTFTIPYGIRLHDYPFSDRPLSRGADPLRVLFVGGVELRKGIPYLLHALRHLKTRLVQCRLIGPIRVKASCLREFSDIVQVIGEVPRQRLLEHLHWADVLAFPSICEGSALVTYEAMSCGVPIIVTPNAGGYFNSGRHGLEVPIRSSDGIAAALERFAHDREFLRFCSNELRTWREELSLEAYRPRVTTVVRQIYAQRSDLRLAYA